MPIIVLKPREATELWLASTEDENLVATDTLVSFEDKTLVVKEWVEIYSGMKFSYLLLELP